MFLDSYRAPSLCSGFQRLSFTQLPNSLDRPDLSSSVVSVPPRFKGFAFPITAMTRDSGDHGDSP